jgi:hypothetical protein
VLWLLLRRSQYASVETFKASSTLQAGYLQDHCKTFALRTLQFLQLSSLQTASARKSDRDSTFATTHLFSAHGGWRALACTGQARSCGKGQYHVLKGLTSDCILEYCDLL